MIYLDESEVREGSLLPKIDGSRTSPVLESLAGADLMISPEGFPAGTEALIRRHVRLGALLVQGKWSVSDLEASVKDGRLTGQLARMVEIGAASCQRVLLLVGKTPALGSMEYSAMSAWLDRGGRVEPPLTSWAQVPDWCKMKERHLKSYANRPLRWVYDNKKTLDVRPEDDPLQLLVRVPMDDPRRAVIQCPGIGPELATAWWEQLNIGAPEVNLFYMLAWMSAEKPEAWGLPKVKGYGAGKREAVRAWLGLHPGYDLGIKKGD